MSSSISNVIQSYVLAVIYFLSSTELDKHINSVDKFEKSIDKKYIALFLYKNNMQIKKTK